MSTQPNCRLYLSQHASWLLDPRLATCAVGTTALAEACRRNNVADVPHPADLDLSWALDVQRGRELLAQHGMLRQTTDGSQERGTLAFGLEGQRIEITTFRGESGAEADYETRIVADAMARDMTVGAIVWRLHDDRIFDPADGLTDWQRRIVRAVGAPAARIAEHPARWLRYYRKAHQWGFELDNAIRKLPWPGASLAQQIPAEVVGAEIRSALLTLASPGRLLMELHEAGLLQVLLPELAPQFDGRPAGPVRYHPEISQALHLVLVLEWAAANTQHLGTPDRLAVLTAALTHDLGKGLTPAEKLPSHLGHERAGRPLLDSFFNRLPGLADPATRRLATIVCELHADLRSLRERRPGTLATMFETYLKDRSLRPDLLGLAVGADSGGRLGTEAEGHRVARQVERHVQLVLDACRSVDARALREASGDDLDAFKTKLHQARCSALRHAFAPDRS